MGKVKDVVPNPYANIQRDGSSVTVQIQGTTYLLSLDTAKDWANRLMKAVDSDIIKQQKLPMEVEEYAN